MSADEPPRLHAGRRPPDASQLMGFSVRGRIQECEKDGAQLFAPSHSLPSLPRLFPLLPCRKAAPFNPNKGLGECCKLPVVGSGGHKKNFDIFGAHERIWVLLVQILNRLQKLPCHTRCDSTPGAPLPLISR